MTLLFLLVTYYALKGGFRSVTGICFWGTVLPIFVVLFLVFPLQYAHFRNILPIFIHSPIEMLQSAKDSSLEFLGFEAILVFYPFIEKGKSFKKMGSWWYFIYYHCIWSVSGRFYYVF